MFSKNNALTLSCLMDLIPVCQNHKTQLLNRILNIYSKQVTINHLTDFVLIIDIIKLTYFEKVYFLKLIIFKHNIGL